MYLLGRTAGWPAQRALWQMAVRGTLELLDLDRRDIAPLMTLMEKYRDKPMALADATLVLAAEKLGLRRIFTLDSDFQIYRLRGRSRIQVVPAP
jgi:predicted nucleic acid-binding protein